MEYRLSDIPDNFTVLVHTKKRGLGRLIQKFQEFAAVHPLFRKITGKKISKFAARWNHAMKAKKIEGIQYFIESDKYGVVPTHWAAYADPKKYEFLALEPDYTVSKDELTELLLSNCGRSRYAFFDILAFAIWIITFGLIWTGKRFEDGNRVTCSQFVAYIDDHLTYGRYFQFRANVMPAEICMKSLYKRHTVIIK